MGQLVRELVKWQKELTHCQQLLDQKVDLQERVRRERDRVVAEAPQNRREIRRLRGQFTAAKRNVKQARNLRNKARGKVTQIEKDIKRLEEG